MSYLILKHLTSKQLPADWVSDLPVGQTFTVSIVAETPEQHASMSRTLNKNKGNPVYQHQYKETLFDPS
ncbi:MAG: hypothetical protein KAH77_09480 [Thiomargarita sp.]|nr:hypothetical protein [Thiomargarita sp.]